MRLAVIDKDLCKPMVCNYICQKVCPVNRTGKDCITIGPDKKVLIDEGLCIGCGICVKKCEQGAITIVNLPEKLKEDPIHRYGPNLFSLYRLPIPKKAVVGLIGPNGVGKTTVLNILSGNLKPNSGDFGGVNWETIISRFKRTELQGYIESLAKSNIKTSYKPQNVDAIPNMYRGIVSDFLKKIDEKGNLDGVVEKLEIRAMMGKEIKSLSGGELQLLAVVATLLKDADFYFFDEPSSYLDVRERLLIAKEIRKLAKKARVMVVEHDLAVADYLADVTHILYGEPGVFGIVSNPYSVRVGINTYLTGYIKEANVAFRPEPVVFAKRSKVPKKRKLFLKFPDFSKRFKEFSLKTAGGDVHLGEIIGILGPNSIGKTTFIKMLAGDIKPDSGRGFKDLELAYKPQRLVLTKRKEEMNILEFLESKEKLKKDGKRIIRFLGLEKLLERKLGSLSGGELQSTLIASVLIQKKDLMLLDEPSAFLDVEQRLRIAKLLRAQAEESETPCFVVDHDLLFMDLIADRVMVFSGKPGVSGHANPPCDMREGMNSFLKALKITFRRDPETGRPRANKPGSVLDREQKERGEYYYM